VLAFHSEQCVNIQVQHAPAAAVEQRVKDGNLGVWYWRLIQSSVSIFRCSMRLQKQWSSGWGMASVVFGVDV
jgi:hypothetical protein